MDHPLTLLMLGALGSYYLYLAVRKPAAYVFVGLFGIASFIGALLLRTGALVNALLGVGVASIVLCRILYHSKKKQDKLGVRDLAREIEAARKQRRDEPPRLAGRKKGRDKTRSDPRVEEARREIWARVEKAVNEAKPRVEKARSEPAPAVPASAGPAPSRWVEYSAPVEAAKLATDQGLMAIRAGTFRGEIRVAHAEHRHDDGETYSELGISLRFGDAEGREWLVTSVVSPRAFSDGLEDQERREATEAADGFQSLADAPEALLRARRDHGLVRGLGTLLDSRRQIRLKVGDERRLLFLAQEEPRIDVALTDAARLLVCVSGLTRKGDSKDGADDEDERAPAWHELAPFVWLDRADLLLCFARPDYHYASFAELMSRARTGQRVLPRAHLTGLRATPQPHVVLEQA